MLKLSSIICQSAARQTISFTLGLENKEYCFDKNHNNVTNIDYEWSMDNSSKGHQRLEMESKSKYKVILQFPIEKDGSSIQIETDIRNIMQDELKRFLIIKDIIG